MDLDLAFSDIFVVGAERSKLKDVDSPKQLNVAYYDGVTMSIKL